VLLPLTSLREQGSHAADTHGCGNEQAGTIRLGALMLGIIGGTSLLFSTLPPLEKRTVATPFGNADLLRGNIIMLMRHQNGIPPHRINHRANLAALAIEGVTDIIAFGSSGSLKAGIAPGSLVIPHDYISVTDVPSIHDHAIEHVRPELSADLVRSLSRLIPAARNGGVYIQTRGPRIETVAEVKALAWIADVVGMTLASEATLAHELGMRFAALCTVENYANGMGEEVLTYEHMLTVSRTHRQRNEDLVKTIIGHLG
jgi:5'-methylthioadenosine phosphorylase